MADSRAIGPITIDEYVPARNGFGAYRWRMREIYGVPYEFQYVWMPNGERRTFVRKWVPADSRPDPLRLFGRWTLVKKTVVYPNGKIRSERFE